jgi:hypothetical protein
MYPPRERCGESGVGGAQFAAVTVLEHAT